MLTGLLMRWQDAPLEDDASIHADLFSARDHDPAWLLWAETDGHDAPAGFLALDLVRDVGAAPDAVRWRYLVHTDIPDTIVDEYNQWYDHEHLPRLVGVAGIFRARRFVARHGGPRYLTAYDITAPDVWESPAALAARKTPWTAKMRGLFQNTDRAFCERHTPHPG